MAATNRLVPYVRRPDWPPHDELVHELRRALDGFDVVAVDELDPADRRGVRVAVVDGPAAEQLAGLPDLEWVHSTWAGADALLDVVPEHVRIARLVDPELTRTMTEAVLAWTLWLHRDGHVYAAQQARREWRDRRLVRPADRRIAVLGLGVLGTAAARALVAHGFDVVGWSRSPTSIDRVPSHTGADGLRSVLARADVVVNLLPDTPGTRGLLDADALAAMPAGASVINFGRGPTIDDDALLRALDDGSLGHAVLDVFDVEPLPVDHPFWDHPAVTVLPHVSGPTSPDTAARIVAANIRAFVADGSLPSELLVDRTRGY